MDTSYAAVLARKNEIMKASLGIDYKDFIQSPIAFDYERLMAATGYSLEDIVRIQADSKVGNTPLYELTNLTAALDVSVEDFEWSHDGRALYFSRSRMPFSRDLGLTIDDAWVAANPCYKHLGLYAYQAPLLEKLASLPPGRYEQIEKLEQLRVLENGYDILVGLTEDPTVGVDTPEDAKRFEESLGGGNQLKA